MQWPFLISQVTNKFKYFLPFFFLSCSLFKLFFLHFQMMQSKTAVADDYCYAWQANHLKIPRLETKSDDHQYFYLYFEVQYLHPSAIPVEDDEYLLVFPELECVTTFQHFWVQCPKLKHDNLSWDEISKMLTKLSVPLHKQPFLLNCIAARADEMANAEKNKNQKVLPMMVSIAVGVDYYSYHQEDESTISVEKSEQVSKLMPIPASKASLEALEKKKVKETNSANKQCMICMERFKVGSETRLLPCSHVYHERCIITWLGLCNFCPICHAQLPA